MSTKTMASPIPITIITGFLGSGKTTLILSLLPQLLAQNPAYKLALLKNEFGDLAVDSQLASSSSISGVRELLNGCICCNLVGQLSVALQELATTQSPDRIIIETSGSAFPATLAMEVNRLARETGGAYTLDGVVTVIDVENWKGYEDTSYTAKIQARYMDLVVFNKWEGVGEQVFDACLDRLGDLEEAIAWVKSGKGKVDVNLVFGIDGGLAKALGSSHESTNGHGHGHEHEKTHQSEVEVLSVTLNGPSGSKIDTAKFEKLLKAAPKDEVYRMKAVVAASSPIMASDQLVATGEATSNIEDQRYILNWAFSRWTCTPMKDTTIEHESSSNAVLRMTMILARYESTKWKKRLETGDYLGLEGGAQSTLTVQKIV